MCLMVRDCCKVCNSTIDHIAVQRCAEHRHLTKSPGGLRLNARSARNGPCAVGRSEWKQANTGKRCAACLQDAVGVRNALAGGKLGPGVRSDPHLYSSRSKCNRYLG